VPHIHAKDERDAYAALGFCMAEDRLGQMDLMRRAATGRLSEVHGREQLRHDALVRTAGIPRRAAAAVTLLQGVGREALAAFVGGVNAVCASAAASAAAGRPIQAWTIADCLAIELYVSWTQGLEVWPAKLLLARMLATAGPERARWIFPTHLDGAGVASEEKISLWRRIDPRIIGLLRDGGAASGSAFAVTGQRSGGGALLGCDLHLPPRLPTAFYLAHLEAPGFSVVGAALVGFPAIIVGRNAACAWGITPLALDDADCVTEELDGIGNFRTEEGWHKLATRREVIRVRDEESVLLDVAETKSGPLLCRLVEQLEGAREDGIRSVSLALRWGVNSLSSSLPGWLALARSDSIHEVGEAAALLDRGPVPLNLVAADSTGSVRQWMAGTSPSRPAEARLPVRALSTQGRWRGSKPASPGSVREPGAAGCVVVAGESSASGDGLNGAPSGISEHAFRARRIEELLAAEPLSTERCAEIQRDLMDLAIVELLPRFREAVAAAGDASLEEIIGPFLAWDGEARADSTACSLVYVAIVECLIPELFPEQRFGLLSSHGWLEWSALARILAADSSPWFADAADRNRALVRALRRSYETLVQQHGSDPAQWAWGRLHGRISKARVEGSTEPSSSSLELPAAGSPFTVDVGRFEARRAPFSVTRAPVLRMVVDLSTRNAKLILAGGESGRPDSPSFSDQLSLWNEGGSLELSLGAVSEGDIVDLMPG